MPEDERVKVARIQADADLRAVLHLPAGLRLLYRLAFDTCNILGGTFTGNSETFYREGRRSIGVQLWAEVQRVSPADAVRAHTEALLAQQQAFARHEAEQRQKADSADEERDE